jgi:hypothetical protein
MVILGPVLFRVLKPCESQPKELVVGAWPCLFSQTCLNYFPALAGDPHSDLSYFHSQNFRCLILEGKVAPRREPLEPGFFPSLAL